MSPFAENGSLPTYLKRHPKANRRLLVSSRLGHDIQSALTGDGYPLQLYQVAMAIAYLHEDCGFIHGDIKGDNILVSRNHTALLSDFGTTRPQEIFTSVGSKGIGTVPWQSPQLLNGESKTFESDIYAFGMTVSEVRGATLRCPI